MQCITYSLELVADASDGVLLVVAPILELRRLRTQSTDDGHMNRTLKPFTIFDDEFRRKFLEFAEHTEDDRWPVDHDDIDARGLPKDGGFLILPSGMPAKCATKIIGLPVAPRQWPGHGTRHETALSLSSFLNEAIVFIRSSSGQVHVLLARDRGNLILKLRWLSSVGGTPSAKKSKCTTSTCSNQQPEPECSPALGHRVSETGTDSHCQTQDAIGASDA